MTTETTVYEYVATTSGTLSNPYRHVTEGERVFSRHPIKASWLRDAKLPPVKGNDILVPYMKIDGRVRIPGIENANQHERTNIPTMSPKNPPEIIDPNYQRAMADLRKAEGKIDKKQDNKGGDAAKAGTGDQDVLASS